MYLLIVADKDSLAFFRYYYYLLKKIFFEVTTILHLKNQLSGDKIAFNIIKLKFISGSPLGNMLVVVSKVILELEA